MERAEAARPILVVHCANIQCFRAKSLMMDSRRTKSPILQFPPLAVARARERVPNLRPYLAGLLLVGAWVVVCVVLGFIVGIAAVILPPAGAFGVVAAVGAALLWVMPDFPIAPLNKARALFVAMLIVLLIVPNYYALDIQSLPGFRSAGWPYFR